MTWSYMRSDACCDHVADDKVSSMQKKSDETNDSYAVGTHSDDDDNCCDDDGDDNKFIMKKSHHLLGKTHMWYS